MAEIPTQFKYEDLLHHTFPGFFSAITLFMLIDVWRRHLPSPHLTSLLIKDISGLVGFVGFVVLIGTILGVLIDGIHHLIVQGVIFNNFGKIKDIDKCIEFLFPKKERDIKIRPTRHYFFKLIGDKAITIDEYLINSKQRYSEFYTNTFIALVPFSLVVPFYLFYILQIDWHLSIILAFISLSLACICLKSGYNSYKGYQAAIYSFISGYVEIKNEPQQVKGSSVIKRIYGIIINILLVLLISIAALIILVLNFWSFIFILITGVLFVVFVYYIWKIEHYQIQYYYTPECGEEYQNKLDELLKIISKNAFGLTVTFLFMLFILLGYMFLIFQP
ncbi:Uncharacterised protein [uncultured archaeon]|nr:Uncharacterised protein [uncultured archaeon]